MTSIETFYCFINVVQLLTQKISYVKIYITTGMCLFVCLSQTLVIFTTAHSAGPTPFSCSWHFNLDFQESREMMNKLQYHQAMNDTHGPRFGTLFCIFSEKDHFFLQGLVRVHHLVLARTRSDFGATLPGGSIWYCVDGWWLMLQCTT